MIFMNSTHSSLSRLIKDEISAGLVKTTAIYQTNDMVLTEVEGR
jgi:hypothetical protein